MNSLRLLAPCAFLAFMALSCSSTPAPTVIGGAKYQVQGGPNPSGEILDCPNNGAAATVASVSSDGATVRLLTDGVDGATVQCAVSDSGFTILLSNANGTIAASGTIVTESGTKVSKDASVTVIFPGAKYGPSGARCTVTFPTGADNGAGNVYGTIVCPKLEHQSLPGKACQISSSNITFFKFQHCGG